MIYYGPISGRPSVAETGDNYIDINTGERYVFEDGAWESYPGFNKELPVVAIADAGKALIVGSDGKWAAAAIPSQLPTVAVADAGKVLTVSAEGTWVAASLPTEE